MKSLLALGLLIHSGLATINCTTGWSWASNSLGQNPCTVVEILEGACHGDVYVLDPLTPGTNYVTPQKNANPPCECNTVMYSLYQACTACQNQTIESWIFYEQFCAAVYVSQYPVDVPLGTAIPHWAFLNVTASGAFNASEASLQGDSPESLPLSPSTASLPGSPSTSTSAFSTSLSTNGPRSYSSSSSSSSSPSPSHVSSKSSNTGAIAGGTVGGVVGLALVGGAIAYLLYRRRQATSSKLTSNESPSLGYTTPMSTQPLKPYDPNDPSTFPLPLHQSSLAANSAPGSAGVASGYPQTTVPGQSGYQGLAEV